jgi:hypothetical protein
LLVNGVSLLPAKYKDLSTEAEAQTEDTTGLGDAWPEHTPTGMQKAALSIGEGLYDDGATNTHEAFRAGNGTARVMVYGLQGDTIGQPFYGHAGVFSVAYKVLAKLGDLTKASVKYLCTGRRDEGVILQSTTTQVADWNTEGASSVDFTTLPQRVIPITSNSIANPSVVTTTVPHGLTSGDIILISGVATSSPTINGERTVTVISATTFSVPVNVTIAGTGGTFVRSNTTGGGAGYLHVTAFSGFSGFVAKVRDSADDVTYAVLVTFAGQTTVGAQRVEVSGTVDRHLAIDGNVTGAGSVTCWVGFARY